jgi:L-lactate dehydrogenase complex protein LldG
MASRDNILARVRSNQSGAGESYEHKVTPLRYENPIKTFKESLVAIGGSVFEIEMLNDINDYIKQNFPNATEIFSSFPQIKCNRLAENLGSTSHGLHDIEVTVLSSEFGVAENGAVWLTQVNMLDRALPFISENLILVISRNKIFNTLHEAYAMLSSAEYQYGVLIAGPSKTADIEQSLVLGAHGAKTLSVFIV